MLVSLLHRNVAGQYTLTIYSMKSYWSNYNKVILLVKLLKKEILLVKLLRWNFTSQCTKTKFCKRYFNGQITINKFYKEIFLVSYHKEILNPCQHFLSKHPKIVLIKQDRIYELNAAHTIWINMTAILIPCACSAHTIMYMLYKDDKTTSFVKL